MHVGFDQGIKYLSEIKPFTACEFVGLCSLNGVDREPCMTQPILHVCPFCEKVVSAIVDKTIANKSVESITNGIKAVSLFF